MTTRVNIPQMDISRGSPEERPVDRAFRHVQNNSKCYSILGAIFALFLLILLTSSWGTLEPTELGLLKNGISGAVDLSQVYTGGRYWVGMFNSFISFPANRVTVSYGSGRSDDRYAVPARTGQGEGDTDSGGQPVTLAVSFQYQLSKEGLADVYSTFGTSYESSYLRFAQQAMTNVAQQFTPRAYWLRRAEIEGALENAVNQTIITQGYASITQLQLRSVGFQGSYEETITNIQLQEQLKVTKEFQYQVTAVTKQVDLLQAQATATVRKIDAEAAREAAVIINRANSEALLAEQTTKADMYARLRTHLNWTQPQFLEYIKLKALDNQPDENVVVGLNAFNS